MDNKFILQASQGISGVSLKRCFEDYQQNQQPLPPLDSFNLSTSSWLSSPTDYRYKHVFCRRNSFYLIGIDNDLALNDPIVRPSPKSYQHVLGIKQILYYLTYYMQSPFDDAFSEHLLEIKPT